MMDSKSTIRRTVKYELKQLDNTDVEVHYVRFKKHLVEKYGDYGYLKLWLSRPSNETELAKIRALIKQEDALRANFMKIYSEETKE